MTLAVYQCACPSATSMLLKDCEEKIYPPADLLLRYWQIYYDKKVAQS